MIREYLGDTFDLHSGGVDLVFPHHENEIAQSEGASGLPLARVWMHNGFVNIDNEKMSKSLGNFFTIRDVLQKFDAETLRFFIVRAHYRSPLNYSDVHLDDARSALRRLYTALSLVPPVDEALNWDDSFAARFKAGMDNDFGTPEAVAVLFDLAAEVNRTRSGARAGLLKALGGCLGLLQANPADWLQGRRTHDTSGDLGGPGSQLSGTARGASLDLAEIEARIAARAEAKQRRDFSAADGIRAELLAQGVVLKDSPSGTTWEAAP